MRLWRRRSRADSETEAQVRRSAVRARNTPLETDPDALSKIRARTDARETPKGRPTWRQRRQGRRK